MEQNRSLSLIPWTDIDLTSMSNIKLKQTSFAWNIDLKKKNYMGKNSVQGTEVLIYLGFFFSFASSCYHNIL